jgi:hypothetical protein
MQWHGMLPATPRPFHISNRHAAKACIAPVHCERWNDLLAAAHKRGQAAEFDHVRPQRVLPILPAGAHRTIASMLWHGHLPTMASSLSRQVHRPEFWDKEGNRCPGFIH